MVSKNRPNIEDAPCSKLQTKLFLPANPECQGGLRTRGYFKHSPADKPLVSVITIVLNGQRYLEQTIKSVIDQTYDNVEYIIIDGRSTDGTINIIKKYEHIIDYWISEPDKGIYDAMNKAIQIANGEWVSFMNAGDQFFGNDVVREVFESPPDGVDVIYGDTEIRYDGSGGIKKAGKVEQLWSGMIFCHQSAFCRGCLLRTYKFNTEYEISADFDFFYSLLTDGGSFLNRRITISTVKSGGLSDRNRLKNVIENWSRVRRTHSSFWVHSYYICRIVVSILKRMDKILLGKSITSSIQKLKYRVH